MSRIAGLHRPADPRPSADHRRVRAMLLCHAGIVEVLSGPQGALGRITRSDRRIGGGAAKATGLQVVLDGRILNAAKLRAQFADVPPGDASLFSMLVRQHGMAGALSRVEGGVAVAVLDLVAGRVWFARGRFDVR